MNLKPNCFEKTKVRWGIFSFFLPQMLKRRTSALLPITRKALLSVAEIEKQKLNYADKFI